MLKNKQVKTSRYFMCPNKCKGDNLFFQNGTLEISRLLTETGEEIEDKTYDFTPTGPVKCRHCLAEATMAKKRTTVITEIAIDPIVS